MRDPFFDVPVTIETSQTGRLLTVTRLGQATDLLLHKWPPERRGPMHRQALKAMLQVMEDEQPVRTAREAFVAAAKEADLFVHEGRFFVT